MTHGYCEEGTVAASVRHITESIESACRAAGRDPSQVRLMAVTKTVEAARVNEAIAAGVTLLGENRAQELLTKYDDYHKADTEIHFIGHLQSNKVRQIIDKVTMIQSLDRLSLAQEISRQCARLGRTMDCLVEVNVGSELTKSGVEPERLADFLAEMAQIEHLHIRGLMAIPPASDSERELEHNFSNLYKLFVDIRGKKIDNVNMDILSMGMSDDFPLAVKHGSNLVRVGSAMFGRRSYP